MGHDHELGLRRLKDAADFVRTYRFDLSNYVLVVSFCRSPDNLAPAQACDRTRRGQVLFATHKDALEQLLKSPD